MCLLWLDGPVAQFGVQGCYEALWAGCNTCHMHSTVISGSTRTDVEWHCACCCMYCRIEHQAQWFTDISGSMQDRAAGPISRSTMQVLKLPQQQSAINYTLDYPSSQLLAHYLPFIGMDNQNYTVFFSICIMLVWIVYVFF